MKKKRFVKSCRFSLIELLVVVSIISILAGLILPALSAARNRVRAISCLNNLKQMGLGVHAYIGDYNDYVMPSQLDDTTGTGNVSFMDYLYNNEAKDKNLYVCPSVTEDDSFGPYGGYDHAEVGNLSEASYVMNSISRDMDVAPPIAGVDDMEDCRGWGSDSATSVKITKVARFSEKLYVFDAIKKATSSDMQGIVRWVETDHGPLPNTGESAANSRDVGIHHPSGSFNVLYGDMHAGSRRITQVEEWVVWVKQ